MANSNHTRRYLKWLAGVFLAPLAGIAALNLVLDPFAAYQCCSSRGLDAYRKNIGSRTGKAEILRHVSTETVILGTSREEIGFDPLDPALGPAGACNLSLKGGNMFEIEHAARQVAAHSEVRRLILGLNLLEFVGPPVGFYDFDRSRFNTQRSAVEYHLENLLSWRATYASINVAGRAIRDKPRYTVRGHLKHFAIDAQRSKTHRRFEATIHQALRRFTDLGAFDHFDEHLASLRRVVQLCRGRRIELVLVIPPVHAMYLESLRSAGTWPQFEAWKRSVAAVVEQERGAAEVPIWDFTGYRGRVAETLPAEDGLDTMQWYWEISHFKQELGHLVLERMLTGGGDDAFGVRLTSASIDGHLAAINHQRGAWIASHRSDAQVHTLASEKLFAAEPGRLRR